MHASQSEMAVEIDAGEIQTRGEEWGGLSVRHLDLPAGADFTPLFKGLPGDCCSAAHWGYVISGSINVRYNDGTEEITQAGEVFHWPAGHTGWTTTGVVFVELSPADDIRPVLEHVGAQLSASA